MKYPHIILASGSPRRRQLLEGLDLPFSLAPAYPVTETYPASLAAQDVPLYLARLKAHACPFPLTAEQVLITADTVVVVRDRMLGKPHSEQEAREMLGSLSATTHQVYTGVCMVSPKMEKSFCVRTDVTFRSLGEEEINYYISHYSPMDKAGAYGIQEWIGYIGITRIEGSYYNVMGFPVQQIHQALSDFVPDKVR